MSSIHSVSSNVTSNTFNTCNTGDHTVQASNLQKRKNTVFKSSSPRIVEEPSSIVYDLSGGSNSSSSSGSPLSVKKLSTSSSNSSSSNKNPDIKYDLSGVKSSDELRREIQKSLSQIDSEARSAAQNPDDGNTKKDDSWLGFLFCYNNDTTTDGHTIATTEHTDSDSTNSGRQSPTISDPPIDLSGEVTDYALKRKSKSRVIDRNPSIASDAALLANARKDPSVSKGKKKNSAKKAFTKLSQAQDAPSSPTRLSPGAGSLDIVMELQLDEDLIMSGKKKASSKSMSKRKGKFSRKSSSSGKKDKSPKVPPCKSDDGDNKSVISERSLFSFASTADPSSPSSNLPSMTAVAMGIGRSVCITGPVNGTFQNVTSEKDAEDAEIANTYNKYRVFERSVDMVLNRISTTVPLYHWKGSQSFRFGDIGMSASSEDLGLSSFSNLNLGSASMRSIAESDIPINLTNVCSEPSAKVFDVRSSSYLKDGKKLPSGEAMFSLLGADNIIKNKLEGEHVSYDVCKGTNSYLSRLTAASKCLGLKPPFLIIINFVVPWGNFLSYYYRPDATKAGPFCDSRKSFASEKLWKAFLNGDENFRNNTLKFIPHVIEGPWALKKLVGTQPAMIGQKIPTKYYGSIQDGYIEICMDVTKGGKMANSICSAVASKASSVSIDLAFLLQGTKDEELPEQLLSVIRLHHVSLKKKKTRVEI